MSLVSETTTKYTETDFSYFSTESYISFNVFMNSTANDRYQDISNSPVKIDISNNKNADRTKFW